MNSGPPREQHLGGEGLTIHEAVPLMLFVLDKTCDKTRGLQNPHGRHHERGNLVRDANRCDNWVRPLCFVSRAIDDD